MPRIYYACLAKCPFFIESGKKNVMCEGVTDDCSINMMFISEDARNLHRRIFCDAKFQNCEIHKMISEKYQE